MECVLLINLHESNSVFAVVLLDETTKCSDFVSLRQIAIVCQHWKYYRSKTKMEWNQIDYCRESWNRLFSSWIMLIHFTQRLCWKSFMLFFLNGYLPLYQLIQRDWFQNNIRAAHCRLIQIRMLPMTEICLAIEYSVADDKAKQRDSNFSKRIAWHHFCLFNTYHIV